jgi:hypothetical protein
MDQTLWDEMERLIPRLMVKIEKALPEELHSTLTDYTLLIVFHTAYRQLTPFGRREARIIVNRWKNNASLIGIRKTKDVD